LGSWIAVDIGGANLKIADGQRLASSQAFSVWQHPDQLATALAELLAKAPSVQKIAVTMTAELADCFATKAEGVCHVLDAVEQAASGRQVAVYLCDGRLVDADIARQQPLLAAASNWHALAAFAVRFCKGKPGLLVDIGSTTSDLIPLDENGPRATGRTDPERLVAGELVYTGVRRSPICGVTTHLPWRGEVCPVAQELFATTADAYLLLGDLLEDSSDCRTADGRALVKAYSHSRMAKAICADVTLFSFEDALRAAGAVCEAQLRQLAEAAKKVLGSMQCSPCTMVLSGEGEFLARKLLSRIGYDGRVVSLRDELGAEASRGACAHALAVLATERNAE